MQNEETIRHSVSAFRSAHSLFETFRPRLLRRQSDAHACPFNHDRPVPTDRSPARTHAHMITIGQLLGGFILLLFGAEYLVRGAVSLARRLNVSPMLIGMTIVAYGTTAPELVVSLEAVLGGQPGISVGNVVGSNIANILLILGMSAFVYPVVVKTGRHLSRLGGDARLGAAVCGARFVGHDPALAGHPDVHRADRLFALRLCLRKPSRACREQRRRPCRRICRRSEIGLAGTAGYRRQRRSRS